MTERLSIAISTELKDQIDNAAEQEGISTSELIRRSAEQYLDKGSVEARINELEQRVDEIEEDQSRSMIDSIFNRDRTPP